MIRTRPAAVRRIGLYGILCDWIAGVLSSVAQGVEWIETLYFKLRSGEYSGTVGRLGLWELGRPFIVGNLHSSSISRSMFKSSLVWLRSSRERASWLLHLLDDSKSFAAIE